jgi:hypothetical protein
MDNVYIKKEELNEWIAKYFPMQDIISIGDLISTIEDLDEIKTDMEERIEELLTPNDYPDEERDREREVLGI